MRRARTSARRRDSGIPPALVALLCTTIVDSAIGGAVTAQDQNGLLGFRDADRVRDPRRFGGSNIALRLGGAFAWPEDTDLDEGRDFEANPSGSMALHFDELLDEFSLDAYLGPDGGLVSVYQREQVQSLSGRLDLSARPLAFYRDGFYREDEFVPVGSYEGLDFGVFLAAEQRLVENLTLSVGPYYRRYDFDDRFGGVPAFVRPGDYNAHGLRSMLQYVDREPDRFHRGETRSGILASLEVEYESNDQRGTFGAPPRSASLPESVFRGSFLLEAVRPVTEHLAPRIRVEGGLHERDDRIAIADAQTPVGTAFVDAIFGLRYSDERIAAEPYARVQFVRALDALGRGSNDLGFFGGGIRLRWNLGDGVRLFADASYLNNPARPVVTWDRGALGEFQLVAGFEWTF